MFGYQKSTQTWNEDPWDARAKKIQKEAGEQWLEVTATRLLRESESVEQSSGTRKYENLEQAKSYLIDQKKWHGVSEEEREWILSVWINKTFYLFAKIVNIYAFNEAAMSDDRGWAVESSIPTEAAHYAAMLEIAVLNREADSDTILCGSKQVWDSQAARHLYTTWILCT